MNIGNVQHFSTTLRAFDSLYIDEDISAAIYGKEKASSRQFSVEMHFQQQNKLHISVISRKWFRIRKPNVLVPYFFFSSHSLYTCVSEAAASGPTSSEVS